MVGQEPVGQLLELGSGGAGQLDHLTYQDSDKSIADHWWWEEHDRNERRTLFTLHGQHSSQRYALIRTASDWLLHLTTDQPAS
ncbi:MAG TPA: hypothetical protein VFN05_15485 [Actinomycetes bacterium]|nr:hypothetical protein [Actinomycetes bacterium]